MVTSSNFLLKMLCKLFLFIIQNAIFKTIFVSIGFLFLIFLVSPSEIKSDVSGGILSAVPSPNFSYYSYNPSSKTLNKLNLSKTIGNGQLSDYFHKNDESLFVLNDGTIYSIIGNSTRKFNTLPKAKKIRIANNQYVALADGKIYTSNNLKNWTLDSTKPMNILDIDVPAQQNNFLHITTPKENLIIDVQQNKVLSSSKPDTKKYGSNVNNFVRFADSGVYLHDKYFQKGYSFADIDHYNRIYLVPDNVAGYKVNNLHTSDQLAIVELNTKNGPDKINVADQIQFYQ